MIPRPDCLWLPGRAQETLGLPFWSSMYILVLKINLTWIFLGLVSSSTRPRTFPNTMQPYCHSPNEVPTPFPLFPSSIVFPPRAVTFVSEMSVHHTEGRNWTSPRKNSYRDWFNLASIPHFGSISAVKTAVLNIKVPFTSEHPACKVQGV